MSSSSYFSRFPTFAPNPLGNIEEEFERLARKEGWKPDYKRYWKERDKCLASEFNIRVGYLDKDDRLTSWQALCSELGIEPLPRSITQCRKVTQLQEGASLY